MSSTRRIGRLIAQRNRELSLQAGVELVLGVIFTIVVFGVVFWIAYLAGFFCLSFWRPMNFALIVTGIFAVVAVCSAWRQVDPFANVMPLTEGQEFRQDLAQSLGYAAGVPVVTRGSLAGFGSVFIGGPANVFDAISTWRHRLPAGGTLRRSAAELLESARNGIDLEQISDPAAALLLHRLALVRVVPTSKHSSRLELTQKGLDTLTGSTFDES